MSRATELLKKMGSINPEQPELRTDKPKAHQSTHGSSYKETKSGWEDNQPDQPKEPDKPREPRK